MYLSLSFIRSRNKKYEYYIVVFVTFGIDGKMNINIRTQRRYFTTSIFFGPKIHTMQYIYNDNPREEGKENNHHTDALSR